MRIEFSIVVKLKLVNIARRNCAINHAQGKMPAKLVYDGARHIPASTLRLTEISLYIDTIFFETQIPNVGQLDLVVYCGTIRDHDIDADSKTSLRAVSTHLNGILQKN